MHFSTVTRAHASIGSSHSSSFPHAHLPSQRDPNWQPLNYRHHRLDKPLAHWLLDPGSLTQKLVQRSGGRFRVAVLQQRIERARLSEYRALTLSPRCWAVVREVVLYGNEQPWVYARTVIPLSTLKGPLRRLHYLGNRPLGAALFADPTMRRHGLDIAAVQPRHLPKNLQSAITASHGPAFDSWGRRSLFYLRNKPLLVGEMFLPDLLCC